MNRSLSELMVHQLPSDCYPPTDSDDESFVVLERSLAPDYVTDNTEKKSALQTYSAEEINQSIEIATDLLSCVTSLSPTPKAPSLHQPDLSFTSDLSPDEVQQKVMSLIEENGELKNTLSQNNMVMKNQYDTLIQWQKDVERVQESHKKKFAETKAYIMKLKEENSRLVELLKGKNSSFVAISDQEVIEKMEKMEETVRKLTEEKERDSKKMLVMEVEIKEKEEVVKKLNIELVNERQALKEANQRIVNAEEEMKKKLTDQELDFDKKEQTMLEHITSLKVMAENLQANLGDPEEVEKLRKQLNAAQATLTDLKQEKKAIDAQNEAKDREIKKLETLLIKMNEANERAEILEQQLSIYKADFESERECKHKAIIDKNQLVEDLQDMQRRNHQLLEEVESLRTKCTFVEVNPRQPSAPPTQQSTQRQQTSLYSCPRCSFGFHNYTALENHVYRCIELDALP